MILELLIKISISNRLKSFEVLKISIYKFKNKETIVIN